MGSLPAEHTGIGAATNGAFLQVGGALGVAVLGSQLSTRYQARILASSPRTTSRPRSRAPSSVRWVARSGSPSREGGMIGAVLAGWARAAFISGMDLGL